MAQIETESSPAVRVKLDPESRPDSGLLGQWVPVELVGETTMHRIFRARARAHECTGPARECGDSLAVESDDFPANYALKVLHERWENDPLAVAVMRREVQVARDVCNPHVVPVLASGLHTPPYFIVMPWLPGRTLAKRLAQNEPLDLPVILWIMRQLAKAIAGMHSAGWMHGDIKPENVFLSPEGHVTLLDLGFARRTDSHSNGGGRRTFARATSVDWQYFTGTGSYLAPETLVATAPVDIRADIYSLGIMFFEMLTGRLPFEGDDLATVIARHREAAVANPRRFAPHVPRDVIHLVRQMLSKQPLRRPGSPQELIDRVSALEILSFSERATTGGFA